MPPCKQSLGPFHRFARAGKSRQAAVLARGAETPSPQEDHPKERSRRLESSVAWSQSCGSDIFVRPCRAVLVLLYRLQE